MLGIQIVSPHGFLLVVVTHARTTIKRGTRLGSAAAINCSLYRTIEIRNFMSLVTKVERGKKTNPTSPRDPLIGSLSRFLHTHAKSTDIM
jgi:hypothetical protein